MARLALLQPDARAAARLTTALTGDHDLMVRSSWDTLDRSLSREGLDGCLLDADHPDRAVASREISRLRERYPQAAIVAFTDPRTPCEYYDLGGMGLDGIVSGSQQPATIRSVVDQALSAARAKAAAAILRRRFPEPGPTALAWAVENAGLHTTVDRLATALDSTIAALRNTLKIVGLPSPARIMLWGRLLLAGARLGRDRWTVEEVAYSLGYATASSLSRAMKRGTGLTPGEIAEGGGLALVLEAILRNVHPNPQPTDAGGSGGQPNRRSTPRRPRGPPPPKGP